MSYDSGDYNSTGFAVFAFSMVFSLVFFLYIGFVHEGVDLKEIPENVSMGMETELADGSDSVPEVDVSMVANPWVESPEMVDAWEKNI